ncbi:type I-E CRISPR-associated protein Cse1/CasA [Rhodospirillum centenum]|uniref:CRISPR-associated protein, CT1972 family n=1 Tax=Rhodospirillum centenum (strain ATCC 51521 / SW) TaxID=414684 RepID=B6IWM6_RHOCS|nr:type I-E CRISPR-associated protein Cse1/CasA [Rhodospirillum centenum]ACJ00700.1 CRISPR-associated protein, CT1972 family [Rhodospirillum centenum SW]
MYWFDCQIPVDRRSGPGVATPLELTSRHGDDPILGVRLGHPLADRGFEFLMRDILQAALAPEDATAWRRMLVEPPGPEALAAALAPYRETFRLDHPTHPALQVRPAPERLAEADAKKPAGSRKPAPEAEEDGEEEEEEGPVGIGALLPDLPTKNAEKRNKDFFTRRGSIRTIGAGAVLPILYANQVLFIDKKGSYYSLPHGRTCILFQLVGRTLWETIWLNVLTRGTEGGGDAVWPARPDDPTAFPWLDSGLRDMSLDSNNARATRSMSRATLHPAHIPMTRRYLLAPPVIDRCDLTGMDGPAFKSFSRWPRGLQYETPDWWFYAAVRLENPKKPDEPQFLSANGPLRFNDWIETAIFSNAKNKNSKIIIHQPPSLRQFRSVFSASEELSEHGRRTTAIIEDGAIKVRCFAQYCYGSSNIGGTSQYELPVWHLPDEGQSWLGEIVSEDVDRLVRIAENLKKAVKNLSKDNKKKKANNQSLELDNALYDALLAAVDGQATEHAATLAALARDIPDRATRQAGAAESRTKLLKRTGRLALALFDETFPIDWTGITDKTIPKELKDKEVTSGERHPIPAVRNWLLKELAKIVNPTTERGPTHE